MKQTVTFTIYGTRFSNALNMRRVSRSDDFGIITNVVHQRVGFIWWHLQFDVEAKLV